MHDDDYEPLKKKKKMAAQNFRQIGIIPSAIEINDRQNTFIRPNVISGQYSDVEHYLDIQFRLLREDFLCGLRNDINEYRQFKKKSETEQQRCIYDLNIYHYRDVNIVDRKKINNNDVYYCSFDSHQFTRHNFWQV